MKLDENNSEVFKEVFGFHHRVKVSNFGNIIRKKRGDSAGFKKMNLWSNTRYLCVGLKTDCNGKRKRIL